MIPALLLLGAVAQQAYLPSNGFVNAGFETGDAPWTWNNSQAAVVARVASGTDGVAAHGGSYESESKCYGTCAANVDQVISGSAYRAGAGTVSIWLRSSKTISASTTDRTLFVTFQAQDAAGTTLARDDVLIAGGYSIGSAWDTTQAVSIAANQWTQVTLQIRNALDGRLGSQLAAVDHVNTLFRMATSSTDLTVFWDDASWPELPDLSFTSLAGAPAALGVGDTFTVTDAVTSGVAASGPFTISFYLSPPGGALTAGTLLGTRTVSDGLEANGTSSASTVLTVPPLAPGVYSFGAVVDAAGQVAETDKSNNTLVQGAVLVGAFSCQHPSQPVDDGNACTVDSCDPLTGVAHVPKGVGSACSDSTICNGTCDAASHCSGGTAIQAPGSCFVARCDPVSGISYEQLAAGTACDDGDPCTYGDTCTEGGACVATPIACTSDACNQRTCNGSPSCTVTPLSTGTCDDGNPCTYGDHCDAGSCVGTAISCTSDACATRACNGTATCSAAYAAATVACDDGNPCTYADQCDGGGGCSGTPVSCVASGPCQQVVCNGTSNCSLSMKSAGTACSGSGSVCGQVCDGVSPYCQPAE